MHTESELKLLRLNSPDVYANEVENFKHVISPNKDTTIGD